MSAGISADIHIVCTEEEFDWFELEVRRRTSISARTRGRVKIRKDWAIFRRPDRAFAAMTEQLSGSGMPTDILFSGEAARRLSEQEILHGTKSMRITFMRRAPAARLKALEELLKSRGLHCETFLAGELDRKWPGISGKHRIEAWRQNFKTHGRLEYADWLLQSLTIYDEADVVRGLRLSELNGLPRQQICLLGQGGSDLKLKGLIAQHSQSVNLISTLKEASAIKTSQPIILLIDQIHSGEQLMSAVQALGEDGKNRQVSIRPCVTTDEGVRKVREFLEQLHPSWTIDTTSTHILCCDSVLKTEMAFRLSQHGYSLEQISELQKFCVKVGSDLVGYATDQSSGSASGLGHAGMGLVSMIDLAPGKSVLPLLRLGSPPGYEGFDYPVKLPSDKFEPWTGLIPHRNTSGAG